MAGATANVALTLRVSIAAPTQSSACKPTLNRQSTPSRFRLPHSESEGSYWSLAIILLLAAILRLWQINESLWLDELHTAWVVSASLSDIPERAQVGNQSPVYFVLPWISTNLFGMSEWALRLPSVLAGLALVAAAYGVTFTITRSVLGAATTALLASFDNNFLFYATEARPYACVQLVAVIQLFLFWKLQERSSGKLRAAFITTTSLLFYLHYTAILVALGEVVVQAIWTWLSTSFNRKPACDSSETVQPSARLPLAVERIFQASNYSLVTLLADLAIVALITLPAASHLFEIAARRDNWATFVNNTDPMLPVRWFSLTSYFAVPIGLLALTIPFARWIKSHGEHASKPSFLPLLAFWFALPVAATWIGTSTGVAPLYFARYLMGIAVAPMLVAGLCIATIQAARLRFIAVILVVGYAFYSSTTVWHLAHSGRVLGDRQEDWMSAVVWLNDNYDRGPVFVRSGLLEADELRGETTPLFKQYCLCPVNSSYRFKNEDVLIALPTSRTGGLSAESIEAIRREGVAWFVINAPQQSHERIRQQVLAALRTAELGSDDPSGYAFGRVQVWRIEVE